jgi:hypothetical protein
LRSTAAPVSADRISPTKFVEGIAIHPEQIEAVDPVVAAEGVEVEATYFLDRVAIETMGPAAPA